MPGFLRAIYNYLLKSSWWFYEIIYYDKSCNLHIIRIVICIRAWNFEFFKEKKLLYLGFYLNFTRNYKNKNI